LSLFGQFLYSRPRTNVNYSQTDRTFFLLSGTPFNSIEQIMVSSEARLPHSSGSVGVEVRPGKRLRITESFLTDRLHEASSALLAQQFLFPTPVGGSPTSMADRLVWNYSQQEFDVLFDLRPNVTLRGGHRYMWEDAEVRAAQARPDVPFETGALRRHVGLAGVSLRAGQRLSVNLDVEASAGQQTFFRADLQDYEKASLRARYQASPSLVLTANLFLLRNTNPAAGIDYHLLSRQNSVSATWNRGGASKLSITAEYSRFTFRSRIDYIAPATLISELSLYRDNGHIGSSIVTVVLPGARTVRPKLSAGGSFFFSSGSRPFRYYQPLGRLSLPFGKHIDWNSDWRWYALSQPFYLFEGFRAHQMTTGFRWTM
jgi:hypothetical protein